MVEYGYTLTEYDAVVKKMNETIKEVTKFIKKDSKLTARDLKDKFGDKVEMAGLIIRFSNVCVDATNLMEKIHSHNFDLRGKVAECSTTALKNITEEFKNTQSKIAAHVGKITRKVEDRVDSRTFAEAVGQGDSVSLVEPMKKALKQIEEDDSRSTNFIVYGIDIDPAKRRDETAVKEQATNILNEIDGERVYGKPDHAQITILGKLERSDTGKAPPVLVRMENKEEAKAVLNNAKKNISAEKRTERKVLREALRKKIKDFPRQHWFIRDGVVTSKGEHSAREKRDVDSDDEEGDLNKSYNY